MVFRVSMGDEGKKVPSLQIRIWIQIWLAEQVITILHTNKHKYSVPKIRTAYFFTVTIVLLSWHSVFFSIGRADVFPLNQGRR